LSALTHFSVRNELTVMTYARILSPRFVPDPFAIYIDSDFLVSKPLSELLPYFHSDKAICATREGESDLTHDCPWGTGPELKKYGYVNSGLLVLNLDKWRKDHLTENLLTFLDKESARCLFFDQSAVNWLLRDDIDYLPSRWNVFGSDYDSGAIRAEPGEINLHFASGMKPWKRPLPTPSHHIWWLFNRIFPPATAPSNPVMQPRNLARYVSSWAQLRMSGNTNQIDTGATLKSWERFWRDRAARIE
jgi:lipopolysaccharide biosynthesis glycosyltransferase